MNLGKMRHKITVQAFKDTRNKVGEISKEWSDIATNIPAEKVKLSASQYSQAEREALKYLYRFKIRNRDDITEDMRLICEGKTYTITHINRVVETGKYEIHLDCTYKKEGVDYE